jgi:YfiH family protein
MGEPLSIIRSRSLDRLPAILCGVSTRAGGVSDGPYDSLNQGFATGDDPARVAENRRRLYRTLGVRPEEVVAGSQVHGVRVHPVTREDRCRGALDPWSAIPETDGLVSTRPGGFLLALSADCPLLALVAPPDRGVLLAHSGWRGLAGGMPAAAVASLAAASGVHPREMLAFIGPAIGPCCYTVGEEVLRRLPAPSAALPLTGPARAAGPEPPPGSRSGQPLDLVAVLRMLLTAAGLLAERIESSPFCASCERERFYSHRRDGPRTGRIAMVLGIRE